MRPCYHRAFGASVLVLVVAACRSSTDQGPLQTHPAGTIVASARLSGGPFAVAASATDLLYVARHTIDSVSSAQLPDATLGRALFITRDPTDVAFNHAGTRAYVTRQFSRMVGVIDVATAQQIDSFPVSGDPFRVLVARDDRTIFISTNADSVFRIDVVTGAVVARFGFPAVVNGLALSPSGDRLYASTINGTLTGINTTTNTSSAPWTLGAFLQSVAVASSGRELYAADQVTAQLYVVSLPSGGVVDSVPLSGGGFEVKVTPDGEQIYVSLPEAGKVDIIDRSARRVLATLTVGGVPRRIAFNRSGTIAAIANEAGWVDFIR